MMMFRWINKQPGIQKFWHFCGHYQDIYDWILPLNKPSDLWFILIQEWENEYGKSGHLSIFPSLKHLMMLLKCNVFRALFYTTSKTLTACRDMQLKSGYIVKQCLWPDKDGVNCNKTQKGGAFAPPPPFGQACVGPCSSGFFYSGNIVKQCLYHHAMARSHHLTTKSKPHGTKVLTDERRDYLPKSKWLTQQRPESNEH